MSLNRRKCVAVIGLVSVKLIKQVPDTGVPLWTRSPESAAWHKVSYDGPYMLVFSPTTPPADHGESPALSDWREHETVLGSASSKAVGGERAANASAGGRLVDPLLNRVVGEWLTRLDNTACTHRWKQAVAWVQFAPVMVDLQPPHPDREPKEAVRGRQLRLGVQLVVVT